MAQASVGSKAAFQGPAPDPSAAGRHKRADHRARVTLRGEAHNRLAIPGRVAEHPEQPDQRKAGWPATGK